MTDIAWFVLADDRRTGPFAPDALVQVLLRHPDPGALLVWRSGLTEWVPASTLPELAALLPPPPPLTNTTASPAVIPATGAVAASELDPKLMGVRGWLALLCIQLLGFPYLR